MLDLSKIQAITLDLDDTLWPVWPTIQHAEQTLHDWLLVHAPQTATYSQSADVKREVRSFALPYDFNGLVNFKHPFQLTPILDLANAMKVSRVEIEGHRSAALLSDGTVLQEKPDIAQRRAEQVAELLRGAGLKSPKYEVRWVDAAPAPDGTTDHQSRRVDVTLHP